MRTLRVRPGKPMLFPIVLIAFVFGFGCSQQEAADAMKEAETAAEDAADTVGDKMDAAKEKGEQIASDLGEKAKGYLAPIKEKLGNLETLKDKPEELKQAVTELIQSIDEKAADIKLPESMSTALATVKEKLIALRDYLEGEVEQAKIDQRVQEIVDSVKSGLGMSNE